MPVPSRSSRATVSSPIVIPSYDCPTDEPTLTSHARCHVERATAPHRDRTSTNPGWETEMSHAAYEHIAASESGIIATIEVRRGPNNFIDTDMVAEIADALEVHDRMPEVRAIVLCAEGKHFCAGADFGSRSPDGVMR